MPVDDEARPDLHIDTLATERNASQLRRVLHDWLLIDIPDGILDDLVLVVYEALANVVEHAYVDHSDGPGPLQLRARRTDHHVVITVTDEGTWRAPTDDRFRGRGLSLMRRLIENVSIDHDHHGTVVHLLADVRIADGTPPDPGSG